MTEKISRPAGKLAADYLPLIGFMCDGPSFDLRRMHAEEAFVHYMEEYANDFYCAFIKTFDIPQGEKHRLLLRVDWKDAMSIDWQLDEIAETRGFSRETFPYFKDGDTVEKRLLDLDNWLRPQALSLVQWDTGNDEYIGWLYPVLSLDSLENITPETMNLSFKEGYVSDKKIDLSPEGAKQNLKLAKTIFSNCEFTHTTLHPFYLAECRFIDCRFYLRGDGRGFTFKDVTFENCSIHFKNANNYRFDHGHKFESCTFSGDLRNSRICNSPYQSSYRGEVRDCDFSNLDIHGTEFRGMAFSEKLKFKGWPVVAMSYGTNLQMEGVDTMTFPSYFRSSGRIKSDVYQEGFNVDNLEKILPDPEEFWAVAFNAPFLDFPGKADKCLPDPKETERLRAANLRANQNYKKYNSAFWMLLVGGFKIVKAARDREDILLDLHVKYLKEL